jgi:acyl-CoA thioesterase
MTEEKKALPLDQVVDPNNFKMLLHEVVKTREPVADGRSFTYKEVKYPYNGKVIYVMGRHVSLEDVFKHGKASCKICSGKGYYFMNITKKRFPDPSEFLMQEEELPKDLSPEQQEKWRKDEEAKTTWRILAVCLCAVKAAHKKDSRLLSNENHNIWMILDYEIKDVEEPITK